MSDADTPTANLKGSSRIYRTDREADLVQLRSEIERAMLRGVAAGHSVTDVTISLDVRGPGLKPMVRFFALLPTLGGFCLLEVVFLQ